MSLLPEIRYATRVLASRPGVTLISLVTLALAIGANTAIFTVYNALLLRTLPFPDANRLVQLGRQYPEQQSPAVSIPKYFRWRADSAPVLTGIAGFDVIGSGFNLVGSGRPERVTGTRVTAEFLGVLGIAPVLGHDFHADDDRPGGPKVVIISQGFWTRRFGARPDIIGDKITLNDEPYTVAGVAPDGFDFPPADLWTLFQFDPTSQDKANYFNVIGRLRPGVSLDHIRAVMRVSGERFRREHPDAMGDRETVFVEPLREFRTAGLRPALLVLLGSVALVLLIACVNVANLQLAQAAERQHEIALRTALGASTGRIVRSLLVESTLLALVSGTVGVLVAYGTLPAILALAPSTGLSFTDVAIDRTVLAFALAVSMTAAVLFGLLPAWHAATPGLDRLLREGSGRLMTGRARGRKLLVAVEVALAMLLTVGAALLAKNLARLQQVEPGFVAEHLLTMKLSMSEVKYGGTASSLALFEEQVTGRLQQAGGISAAALTLSLPLEIGPDLPFTIEGQYVPGGNAGIGDMQYRAVTPGYFEALGIRVRRGRPFAASDRAGARPVVIVNEAAAATYWPGVNALGRRLTIGQGWDESLADPWPREIVGIVENVRESGLGTTAPPVMYIPLAQQNDALNRLMVRLVPLSLVVRSTQPVGGLARTVTQVIQSVDPEQPVSDVRPMTEIVSESLGSERFNSLLLGAMAGLALLLAAVGLYGVLAQIVMQRSREIGLRMALGATAGDVLRMFLTQGLLLAITGITVGLLASWGATRFLVGMLSDVSPTDPWVLVTTPAVLLMVALTAILRPVLRAARLDPARVLRIE